jgi:hypothetical protein
MMAPKAHIHKDLLSVIQKAKPSLRKAILKEADKALVYSICEICDNTLIGNLKLSDKQKNKIKRHKNTIRKLAQRGGSWQKKKKHLVQTGGAFLPILLSFLAPILGSAIAGS